MLAVCLLIGVLWTGNEDGGQNGSEAVRAVGGPGDHDTMSRVNRWPGVGT